METFLIIIHFIITILLMIVILLQSSKGGGLAGVFGGGGGMGAVFGGRGAASFLSKVTTILAALFLGLALLISYIDKGKTIDNSVARERLRQSSPASVLPTVQQEPTAGGQSVPAPATTPIDTSR